MGFGPPAQNRKKIAPEIGPEIGPAEKIEKKWGKIRIFRVLSHFFPIFLAGPILGPISGAIIFLYFGPEARNPFFTRSAGSQTYILKYRVAPVRFGCGLVRVVPVFGSSGLSVEGVFLCLGHSLTERHGSGFGLPGGSGSAFGSWKNFKKVLTVPVSGSGSALGLP